MLYPVLNAKRKRYSLDGVWNFKQGEYVPGVDPRLSTEDLMVVPSSFNDVAVESEKDILLEITGMSVLLEYLLSNQMKN